MMLVPSRWPLPLRTLAFLTCFAVIAWLSLTPQQDLPATTLSDKVQHTVAYAVLAAAGLVLFPRQVALDIALCLAFGVLIEILQATMGLGRQGDWRDAVANTLGVLLIMGPFAAWSRLRARTP